MRLYFTLLVVTVPLCILLAQSLPVDTLMINKKTPDKNLFKKIGHLISDLDTNYVSPNKYNLAFMLENSNWYEYYRFRSTDNMPQTLTLAPNMSYKLGAYIGWKWIFIGYSIDLRNLFNKDKGTEQRTEFGLSLYSSIAGCDLYYRKSGNSFKLRNMKDFLSESHTGKINKDIDGFSVDIAGLNAYWIFNHTRFSYPAAYSQSTNQRRNAGSIIAGFSFSKHSINFDYDKIQSYIPNFVLDDGFKFKHLKYTDYSLSLGYAYNWVFARNCLFNASITPAIAYKHSKFDSEVQSYPVLKNINFDLITRAGITYNNSKYFIGASLVMHTYDYRSDNFYMNNSFGTIRIYAGFNFWKKKEYREK